MAVRKPNFPQFVVSPPTNWPGLVVSFAFGVTGNIAASLIGFSEETSFWTWTLWLLSLVVLIVLVWYLYHKRWSPEPDRQKLVPKNEQPHKHQGLVLLVGTGRPGEDPMSQSAGQAIRHHLSDGSSPGLQYCWLIASGGEKGSLPVAYQLQKFCRQNKVEVDIYTIHSLFSKQGVQETYDLVRKIYEEEVPKVGLTPKQVICDFTGGVKTMTAGMVLACGDRYPMQYMQGRKEGVASLPMLLEFAPEAS